MKKQRNIILYIGTSLYKKIIFIIFPFFSRGRFFPFQLHFLMKPIRKLIDVYITNACVSCISTKKDC